MVRKNKKFDCVEMKNAIQQQLRQEYQQRKNEFASYVDFVNVKANDSEEVRRLREHISKSRYSSQK